MTLEELIDTLTERPVAFHRGFVKLTGSINAALMLSQAMYWRKRTKDENGWFYKSREEWEQETGMTRREQENARSKLLASGLWEEWRDRINHRIYFRVKMETLGVMAESALTDGTKAPLPNGGKRPSSNRSETIPEITDEICDLKVNNPNTPTLKTPPSPSPQRRAAPSSPAAPEWSSVKEWAEENRWPIEKAAEFFNYYDARGWEVKGSKIRKWEAQAQSWLNKWRQEQKQSGAPKMMQS